MFVLLVKRRRRKGGGKYSLYMWSVIYTIIFSFSSLGNEGGDDGMLSNWAKSVKMR